MTWAVAPPRPTSGHGVHPCRFRPVVWSEYVDPSRGGHPPLTGQPQGARERTHFGPTPKSTPARAVSRNRASSGPHSLGACRRPAYPTRLSRGPPTPLAAPLAQHSGRFRALERHKTSPHSNAAAADVPPLEVRGGFRGLRRTKPPPNSSRAAAGVPLLDVGEGSGRKSAKRIPTLQRMGGRPGTCAN